MDSLFPRETAAKRKFSPGKHANAVKIWLATGLFMILVQVIVGGVTRLTGSGLSITRWEIVTGTLPPLNAGQWEKAFDLYKTTPQYRKINEGMSLSDFKFIYFWEYVHRLWARFMGFVFIIPFFVFYFRGMLDKALIRRLGVVVLLAMVVASFGWVMVASGLIDRPWVNAYKLSIHLSLALVLFGYLLWTALQVINPAPEIFHNRVLKKGGLVILIVAALQIMIGGVMSGMKAGLSYPTWPDMNGHFLPGVLLDSRQWTVDNLLHYDDSAFMPALVQTLHRSVAYVLTIIGLWFFFRGIGAGGSRAFRVGLWLLLIMLTAQVLIGIFTLVNCVGTVPVGLGVIHQAGALILLAIIIYINFQMRSGRA